MLAQVVPIDVDDFSQFLYCTDVMGNFSHNYVTIDNDNEEDSMCMKTESNPSSADTNVTPMTSSYSRMVQGHSSPYNSIKPTATAVSPKKPQREFIVGTVALPQGPALPPRNAGLKKDIGSIELQSISKKPKQRCVSGDSDTDPYARLACKTLCNSHNDLKETEINTPKKSHGHDVQLVQGSSDSGFAEKNGSPAKSSTESDPGYMTEAEVKTFTNKMKVPETQPGGTPCTVDLKQNGGIDHSASASIKDSEEEDALSAPVQIPSGVPVLDQEVQNCAKSLNTDKTNAGLLRLNSDGYVVEEDLERACAPSNGQSLLIASNGGCSNGACNSEVKLNENARFPTKKMVQPPNGFVISSDGYCSENQPSEC